LKDRQSPVGKRVILIRLGARVLRGKSFYFNLMGFLSISLIYMYVS